MADRRAAHLARLVLAVVALAGCGRRVPAPDPAPDGPCVAVAAWVDPATRRPVPTATILERARHRRIVLLGERHDWVEDHRWQACTLSMLHGAAPQPIVGFEAFTPAADAALRRWVAGERTVEAFLEDVDWKQTWGFPHELYLPLFTVGRLLGLELHGINVDRAIVRRVARKGRDGLTEAERAALPATRPASPGYRARLAAAFAAHACREPEAGDPAFERFVEAQRTWDAAMAAALARLADAAPDRVVVGIVGRGHVEHGDGIVADLVALGHEPLVLLPWESATSCAELAPDLADAVFGIAPLASEIPEPPPSPCDRERAGAHRPR